MGTGKCSIDHPESRGMAATHQTTGEHRDTGNRAAFPFLATIATFGAALAFGGVGAVTWYIGGNGIGMVAGAIVLFLAGCLLPSPWTRTGALLLVWNGLGIACALFVVGVFSVGALMAFPLMLIAIAMSSWPKRDGESIVSLPAIVSQIGGFLLIPGVYGMYGDLFDDLRRLVGL
jgi:hypothetical protein